MTDIDLMAALKESLERARALRALREYADSCTVGTTQEKEATMATQVQVGQKVRINERYGDLGFPKHVGKEFVVTKVKHSPWRAMDGELFESIIIGDPMGEGIWANYVDIVPTKAGTMTLIPSVLSWFDQDRMVRVTSGTGAISLDVGPNPFDYGNIKGSTTLTPDQAEHLAQDLLARVAEIRAVKK